MKCHWSFYLIFVAGCCSAPQARSADAPPVKREIRGEPILPLRTNAAIINGTNISMHFTSAPSIPASTNGPAPAAGKTNAAGFINLGFDVLGGFAYDITNVHTDAVSGREQTRPLSEIPRDIKAYDGKKISITGYVMPLRMKGGRITEFLLVRDQASCCFGSVPQINHWIRVKMKGEGIDADYEPQVVYGTLRVGENYEQGYLTGIYQLEADTVHVAPDLPR